MPTQQKMTVLCKYCIFDTSKRSSKRTEKTEYPMTIMQVIYREIKRCIDKKKKEAAKIIISQGTKLLVEESTICSPDSTNPSSNKKFYLVV